MTDDVIHEFGPGVIAKKVFPEVFHRMAFLGMTVMALT
jgi:hypothetical protein